MTAQPSIRPATPDDFELYARLLPELGVDDPPPEFARWSKELMPSTLVGMLGNTPAGWCFFQALEGSGYVRQIVVAPSARRTGVGRALLEAVRGHLVAKGCRTWQLNVKPHNEAAIALYESLGFRKKYESSTWRVPWAVVPKWPHDATLEISPLLAEDDAAVTAHHHLTPGQLALARGAGRVVVRVHRAGAPLGVAVFDAAYPGCFPFRVASPAAARALLEALQPHSPASVPHVGLVVEDDRAFEAALREVGAENRLVIANYEGPLG